MFTIEQKVDLIMRYIASSDDDHREELRRAVVEALNPDGVTTPDALVSIDSRVEDYIDDILGEIGVAPNLLGYDYSAYAIKLILKDRVYLEQITIRLYPEVAAKFNTTSNRVERAIRHAVTTVFDRTGADELDRIFGNTVDVNKGKLTNSEFLAFVSKKVTRKLRQSTNQ